jgi:hypothetical protein
MVFYDRVKPWLVPPAVVPTAPKEAAEAKSATRTERPTRRPT